jgi:hypothetical protein
METGVTELFGIEIPSTSPLFLTIVGLHVVVGLAAVIVGAIAIFSRKSRGRHSRFGTYYYSSVVATFATAAALTAMRFVENLDVMVLGVFCLAAAMLGRTALRRRWRGWAVIHISSMGLSYVLLLTAFYLENGADLPLWDLLPPIVYWLLPGAIGVPIILVAMWRHPVARRARRE